MSADELDAYAYTLPPERIAQAPCSERDGARLLVLDRAGAALDDRRVTELPELLRPGDLLVCNVTRVVPARLRGRKETGGSAEALLLGRAPGECRWRAYVRARGRLRPGQKLRFASGADERDAEIAEVSASGGEVVLAFSSDADPHEIGETPLPPYIRREAPDAADAERYQTVFARVPGSVAAPTAGLHLSERLLHGLRGAGVGVAEVVLHVGPGTFRPLRPGDLARGRLHAERYEVDAAAAEAVAETRASGGRVVAVGTTSARVLESVADDAGRIAAGAGETELLIQPGHRFRAVDALLTNFHLPRSSLLVLVAAFAGRERVLAAYAEAVRRGYRFYSYGDAMLVL